MDKLKKFSFLWTHKIISAEALAQAADIQRRVEQAERLANKMSYAAIREQLDSAIAAYTESPSEETLAALESAHARSAIHARDDRLVSFVKLAVRKLYAEVVRPWVRPPLERALELAKQHLEKVRATEHDRVVQLTGVAPAADNDIVKAAALPMKEIQTLLDSLNSSVVGTYHVPKRILPILTGRGLEDVEQTTQPRKQKQQ